MTHKPGILKIIQGDSLAASALGAFAFMLVVTIFSLFTNRIMNEDGLNSTTLAFATAAAFLLAIVVVFARVKYVTELFENGSEVKARITSCKTHKANMKLTLRYTYLSQEYEKKFDQVITMKTKRFINENEAVLVVDRERPERFILRDAYL